MWQKARIIRCPNWPHLVGRELWVESKPPETNGLAHKNPNGETVWDERPYFNANVESEKVGMLAVRADTVELLPQFADSVETLKWEDFSR